MPLSLKAKLQSWVAALRAYDVRDYELALELFSHIPKSSVILTNIGLIHAAQGEHAAAVESFIEATLRDPYLAVAYFQCGVSNFLLARYEFAYRDFREGHRRLRGHGHIDYTQLGLPFVLLASEILFNQALCLVRLGQHDAARADLERAVRALRRAKAKAKGVTVESDGSVIEDALRDMSINKGMDGYTVLSIPRGVIYRPSPKKLEFANAGDRDFLGEARLIAAIDLHDLCVGFTGPEHLQQLRFKSRASSPEPEPERTSTSSLGSSESTANDHERPPAVMSRSTSWSDLRDRVRRGRLKHGHGDQDKDEGVVFGSGTGMEIGR
ncbi:hypothetical protein C8F01DRAFT_1111287 [Mycena amicta]|nr:hypothetical protein C8F01DRAFT_1111287 [Mycena amicta]